MKYRAYLLIIMVILTPSFAQAETVLRIGEDVSVDENQTVDGDYYVSVGPFGNTTMSGTVSEDMYALGGSVTVNGDIGNDLSIIGGSTEMHASVTDDVRIVGGNIVVAEHVGGDLFVIGGSLKVLSTATIGGDVIFFGGNAEIKGKVDGSILGSSERMRIDAEVGGNVDVKTAMALTLGDKTNVKGFVSYTSTQKLSRSPSAIVGGEINQSELTDVKNTKDQMRNMLIPLFVLLFATLSLYLLFKNELQAVVSLVHASPAKSTLVGLLTLVLGPIVALLLIATVLGVLVGAVTSGLVILAYALGLSLSGIVAGTYLSKMFTNHVRITLPWILAGTVSLYALMFVPVIGIAIALFVFAVTVGSLVLSLYKHL